MASLSEPIVHPAHPVSDSLSQRRHEIRAAASKTVRRTNWAYAGTFLALHLLALLILVPWFFSWVGVICFWAGVVVFGQFAIPIGYHRLLTHGSFKTPKWFEHILATLAMCAGQETRPVGWLGIGFTIYTPITATTRIHHW